MKIKTLLTTLLILASLGLSAQNNTEGETFQLAKQGAHYVFTASINGTADATILVESGIPALLADSAFVFSSGILSDMELTVAEKEKLSLESKGFLPTMPTWNCGRPPLLAVRWWGNSSSQNSANSAVSLSLTQWLSFDFDQSVVYMKG